MSIQQRARCQTVEDLRPATHTGYLTKRGGVRKNWKRRWFRLVSEDGELSYLEESALQSPKMSYLQEESRLCILGTINLFEATAVRRSACPTAMEHEFEIETPGRVWRMHADTAEELEEWLAQLASVIEAGTAMQSALGGISPAGEAEEAEEAEGVGVLAAGATAPPLFDAAHPSISLAENGALITFVTEGGGDNLHPSALCGSSAMSEGTHTIEVPFLPASTMPARAWPTHIFCKVTVG